MGFGSLDKVKTLDELTQVLTEVPIGTKIRKMEFGVDADGNTAYIKYFDETQVLVFTLTFSNAGAVDSTWTIIRT